MMTEANNNGTNNGAGTMIDDFNDSDIQVGTPASVTLYTDSHAARVVRVSPSGKTVWVQEDKATLTNPDEAQMGRPQVWKTEPNPDGKIVKVTRRAPGYWKTSGSPTNQVGGRVYFGTDYHHFDFCF